MLRLFACVLAHGAPCSVLRREHDDADRMGPEHVTLLVLADGL
jgi:hypothetical protein